MHNNGMKKRCGHPNHQGPRWLPVEKFHRQGRRNGKQQYRSICKICANGIYRAQYHSEKGRAGGNQWKHKHAYLRARSRALTRLSKLVPELYQMVLKEELESEKLTRANQRVG